jgi:(E)-4-hydroxy-3-methyl-but-2-enyl pyrophosphate reductase
MVKRETGITKEMKVLIPKDTGFCFGVQRAVSLCEQALKKYGRAVSPGPIIHNERVMKQLVSSGLRIEKKLDAGTDPVIIPSHGLHPETRKNLEEAGRVIIDATCPRVRDLQELVCRLRTEGYRILIIGKPDHPEVAALLGFTKDVGWVFPLHDTAGAFWKKPEVSKALYGKKVAVVSQTTVTEKDFYRLLNKILSRRLCVEYRIFDTVCRVTERRQEAALKLSEKVDLMLVAGSANSANTTNLYRLLRQRKEATVLLSGAEDLQKEQLSGCRVVGLVSGTSAPMQVINEIKTKIERMWP